MKLALPCYEVLPRNKDMCGRTRCECYYLGPRGRKLVAWQMGTGVRAEGVELCSRIRSRSVWGRLARERTGGAVAWRREGRRGARDEFCDCMRSEVRHAQCCYVWRVTLDGEQGGFG